MTTPIAVTIAGSDSGGGAGIQADLKTFSALGVYGASVITALTAQNTKGVTGIHDVPPDFITAQIDAVFSDLDVRAVKIGMLSQPAVIEAVAAGLDRWKAKNVVLDPVMVATSGDRLLNPDAIDVLKRVLIPRALVITPNLPEAAALLDEPIARNEDEMLAQAGRLRDRGARAVLIKGGHGDGAESVDMLVDGGVVHAARDAARRHQEHPRHRLHAVVGDRRRSRQGPRSRRRRARGQGLCQRGDRRRATGLTSVPATGRCIISTSGGELPNVAIGRSLFFSATDNVPQTQRQHRGNHPRSTPLSCRSVARAGLLCGGEVAIR